MVVRERAGVEHPLAARDRVAALAIARRHQRPGAQRDGAAEALADLDAHRPRLVEELARLRPVAGVVRRVGEDHEVDRREPSRRDAAREREAALGGRARLVEPPRPRQHHRGALVRHHLADAVADLPGRRARLVDRLEAHAEPAQVHAGDADHAAVGEGGAHVAAAVAQLDAARERVVRGEHPALRVVHVGEAGQRLRLAGLVPRLARVAERPRVVARARLRVAAHEVEAAAQVGDAGERARRAEAHRDRLGGVERGEPRLHRARQAVRRRDADVRLAAPGIVGRERERALVGGDRGRRVAELARELALERRERVADRARRLELRAAPRERERGLVAQRDGRRAGGLQVRLRRGRILGPVEVRGAERRVAPVEPGRRAPVQLAARAVQERRVGAVADERVREHELARRARGMHERARDRLVEPGRTPGQRGDERRVETHADHRRRLQRRLRVGRQPVEPCEHDVRDRRRQRRAVRAALEELGQEQRIALRPLDAAPRHFGLRLDEDPRELERLVGRQRLEVETLAAVLRPRARDRVAVAPRRDDQRQRVLARPLGDRAERLEDGGRRPVDVLDDEHGGRPVRGTHRGLDQRLDATARPRRRIHRGEPAAFALRRAGQVRHQRLVLAGHPPVGDRAVERGARGAARDVGRDADERPRERGHRVASLRGAEVHDRRLVHRASGLRRRAHELLGEPRLPEARIAAQQQRTAPAFVAHRGEQPPEPRALLRPPDEALARRGRLAEAAHAPHGHLAREPPHRHRSA